MSQELKLTDGQRRWRSDQIDLRARRLDRFAVDDPSRVPRRVRGSFSPDRWLDLSVLERRAVIRAVVTREVDAEQEAFIRSLVAQRAERERLGPRSAESKPTPTPAPAPARVPEPEPVAFEPRVFVPCIGGCGRLLPARPGRAIAKVCSEAPRYLRTTRRPGARQLTSDQVASRNKQKKRRSRAVCGGHGSTPAADETAPAAATPPAASTSRS